MQLLQFSQYTLLPNSAKKRGTLLMADGRFPNWRPRRMGALGFQIHFGQALGSQVPGTINTNSFTPRAPQSLFSGALLGATQTFS